MLADIWATHCCGVFGLHAKLSGWICAAWQRSCAEQQHHCFEELGTEGGEWCNKVGDAH